jgi:hypothetical protein
MWSKVLRKQSGPAPRHLRGKETLGRYREGFELYHGRDIASRRPETDETTREAGLSQGNFMMSLVLHSSSMTFKALS